MAKLSSSLPKPTDVLDREREWTSLVRALEVAGPNLYFVLGRRRAGKSYLLTRFVEAAGGLYYQATRKTEREQLRDLSLALGNKFDDAVLREVALPDWDAVLRYVTARTAGKPFVLALDEFPYLVEAATALPSILQRWWDHELPGTRLTVILSGSHVTAMKRLEYSDQPLYGRRTGRLDLRPFDYLDAARFVPGWSAREKLLLYGVYGGLPGHLALVDPELSLAENAAEHLLSTTGRLFDEAIHAFDTFLGDAGVHYSIVEAIAGGEQKFGRISSRIGRQTSALARPLEWLLEMEVVERVAPVTDYPNPNPKRMLYRLTDPYLFFWNRFVREMRMRGLTALVEPELVWRDLVAPRLDDYAGPVFEEVCRQFVARGSHPVLPFRPMQVGSWWNADSSEQVDVVALGMDGGLLVGECKWGKVGFRDLDTLRRRGLLIAQELSSGADPVRRTTHVLFSAGGMDDDAETAKRLEEDDVLHVTLEQLYE